MPTAPADQKREVRMRRLRLVQSLAAVMVFFSLALPAMTQEKGAEGAYTIKQGDTLWDISSRFLKNPFLWPKVWQRNPYITNPHWIYPGNPIRLSPLEAVKKEGPAKVAGEERLREAPPPAPVASEPAVKREEPPPIEKTPEVIAEVKKHVEEPPYFPESRFSGFFSNVDHRGIGMILESREGKSLMAEGDIVYLALKTSEPILIGNKYTVFRPSEVIRHPVTDEKLGRRYNVTGNLQIIDRSGRFFTARVIEAFQEIQKGDIIQHYDKERMERTK
jgi:hypothetical protein